MVGLLRLQLAFMIFAYCIGWVCHAVVFAGIFALLDKVKPELVRRKRVQLEYWISALAALCSMAIPVAFIWFTNDMLELSLPLIIAGVGTFIGYRRVREKAIEPELLKGDVTGYAVGLVGIGVWFWLLTADE